MVASNIRCIVVEVPVNETLGLEEGRLPSRPRARDLLPWADPYIATLIRNLQDEVREERAAARSEAREIAAAQATFLAEAQPPLVETPVESDPTHENLWPQAPEWDDR